MVKSTIDIELRLKATSSSINKNELITKIMQNMPQIVHNSQAFSPEADNKLSENIDRILVTCPSQPNGIRLECDAEHLECANYFLYTTKDFGAMAEEVAASNGEEASAIGSYQWELPATEFDGLWESLVYEIGDCPKQEIVNFIRMTMEFTKHGVDPTIIPQNRLILLNGPPGTGKTTLCKAIAQKMAIRMQNQSKRAILVEVNSHSLFSKWFSESGKLIQKLFTRIEELAERPDWLIFVLIDEVESLTMGREASFSGNDPTDSVRAVNAVLTQLDKMKRHQNVFILCTSNIEHALDAAFIDRVGLVRHIGPPREQAIMDILENCIGELTRTSLLLGTPNFAQEIVREKCQQIASHCACAELSGRALRRLSAQAFAAARQSNHQNPLDLATFLDYLQLEAEKTGRSKAKDNKQSLLQQNGINNLDDLRDNLSQI